MSGGGIRSAAFQLGILTGLNASDGMHEKWLSKIDYIASVSGGSWANGEY
jgi:predicted acylesterase/phospholipase RssA